MGDEVEEEKQQETDEKFKKDHDTIISKQEYIHIFIPFLLVIPLFIYFLYQSITTTIDELPSIHKRNPYREMWLSCFFSPVGAIMRYKLSFYFNKSSSCRQQRQYIPYLGTFLANIIGSIIAVICISF